MRREETRDAWLPVGPGRRTAAQAAPVVGSVAAGRP